MVIALAMAAPRGPAAAVPSRAVPTARPLWQVVGEGRGRPAVDGTTAYFLTRLHDVVALDAISGTERWRSPTGTTSRESSLGSIVLLAGDTVVAGDDAVVGLARETGRMRWRFAPGDGHAPGPYLGDTWNGVVFAGSTGGRLHAIDAASGEVRWSAPVTDDVETTVFEPTTDGDVVVAGYSIRTAPHTGGVVAIDAATGEQRWRTAFPPAAPFMPNGSSGGTILAGHEVLAAAGDGHVWALSLEDGAVRWSLPPIASRCGRNDGTPDYRPLALAGRRLFVGSLTGCVTAHDLDTRLELWNYWSRQEGSVAFRLTAGAQRVYVPYLSGRFVAVDAADGTERWRFGNPGDGFLWEPTVNGARVYVAATKLGFMAFHR